MRLFYTVMLAVLCCTASAQSNYNPGYVLKNNGDTLRGYINYREWALSPKVINFKTDLADKQPTQFDPQNIKAFQITGMDTYISYNGIISTDRTAFPNLPDGLDTSKKQASIFLQQLVSGNNLILYVDNDEHKKRFFIAESNSQPVELKYFQYYSDQKEVVERQIFRGQLIIYINKFYPGNNELLNKAERTIYNEQSLTSLINAINGNKSVKGNTNKRSGFRFFTGAGAFYETITYTNKNYIIDNGYGLLYSNRTTKSTFTAPQLNLGLDMFINPNVQQLILRTELTLYALNVNLAYPVSRHSDIDQQTNVVSYSQYVAALTPQFIFNAYNKDNLKLYIDAGASLNFSSYSNPKITVESTGAVDPYTHTFNFSQFSVAFPLQAGVVFNKRLEVCVTYIPYYNTTSTTSEFISNQLTGIGVKYLLGRK